MRNALVLVLIVAGCASTREREQRDALEQQIQRDENAQIAELTKRRQAAETVPDIARCQATLRDPAAPAPDRSNCADYLARQDQVIAMWRQAETDAKLRAIERRQRHMDREHEIDREERDRRARAWQASFAPKPTTTCKPNPVAITPGEMTCTEN